MKTVLIAFDVDGTLISNQPKDLQLGYPVANERIRNVLIALASMKNTKIIVWSGGGAGYAEQVVHKLGLQKYVDGYASKNPQVDVTVPGKRHVFIPDIKPHLAFDDIQDCDLGEQNIIVREK